MEGISALRHDTGDDYFPITAFSSVFFTQTDRLSEKSYQPYQVQDNKNCDKNKVDNFNLWLNKGCCTSEGEKVLKEIIKLFLKFSVALNSTYTQH